MILKRMIKRNLYIVSKKKKSLSDMDIIVYKSKFFLYDCNK